jgi:hypothetical protein
MKSFTPQLAVLLLPVILLFAARQSRAEMWCGNGPGTALSHPCTDDDENPVVSAAIAKYQDRWIHLEGVWNIREGDPYHHRVADIEVDAEPASVASVRKQIPPSVDGIPVVIVPSKTPAITSRPSSHFSSDPAESARRARQIEDPDKAEAAYALIVQKYAHLWHKLPGVLGVGPASCDRDGCDLSAIAVTVQRELLPVARGEIPDSVNGVPIVLTPED